MKLSYLIAGLAALGFASQAMADPYNYPYNRGYNPYYHNEYRPTYPRRRDAGDVILPLVGGVILGAIISNSSRRNNNPRIENERVYRQPAPREYIYDPGCDCYR
jgi:hypothetical protein